MSLFDYAPLSSDAVQMIADFGRPMAIVSSSTTANADSPFDPGAATSTATDVVGVQTHAKADEVEGNLIAVGERKYLFDARVPVTEDDRIRDEGRDWPIKAVREIKPGGTLLIYKVFVKS